MPIRQLNTNRSVQILAKLESFNPGGSVKDRPAFYMIEEAERTGELTKDKIILEATSGNTGIGLSLVAAVKGYRILLVMSEAVSEERKKILKAMGADLQFTPAHMGTDGSIEFAYNLAREEAQKFWLADQFNNDANWLSHYHGTAEEIWEQTGGDLDMIVASMGTTGTLMGLARRFKEVKPEVQIVGVEPYMGHKIQGLKNMKESYPPGIYDRKRADRIIHVDDGEAFETARLLAKKEGLFVGMSAGAAMAVALRLAREMKEGTDRRHSAGRRRTLPEHFSLRGPKDLRPLHVQHAHAQKGRRLFPSRKTGSPCTAAGPPFARTSTSVRPGSSFSQTWSAAPSSTRDMKSLTW